MIKKQITYTDYNGDERTEDFYFHLNKAELTEMELSTSGGLAETINRITVEHDGAALVNMFKEIILKSYGKKSIDGRRFEKSEEISKEFSQTEAYSQLFMELVTDTDAATQFMNGIIPNVE